MRFLNLALAASLVAFAMPTFSFAQSAAAPLRVCTALKDGNYNLFGEALRKDLGKSVPVEVLLTEGSWDNLARLKDGSCDAAIVQSDADFLYRTNNAGSGLATQRIGAVFNETLNLVCNASLDIDDLGDLLESKPKVAVGKTGSGSWVSWNGLVTADKLEGGDDYSVIQTDAVGGDLALTQTVDGSDVGCMFFTMGPNSPFAAKIANVGDALNYVEIEDKDFNDTLDRKGKPIYTPTTASYNGTGFFSSSTDTYFVTAGFYVNEAWASAHDSEFNTVVSKFLTTVNNFKIERKLQ